MTTDALLATVREVLRYWPNTEDGTRAETALDSLAAELREEARISEMRRVEGERMLAALERVKAERDAQQRRIEDLEEQAWPWEWVIATRERERWKVAEARLDKALSALREIEAAAKPREWETPGHPMNEWTKREPVLRLARAAITEIEGEADERSFTEIVDSGTIVRREWKSPGTDQGIPGTGQRGC